MLFSTKFHVIVPLIALFLSSCSTPTTANASTRTNTNAAAKLEIGINTNEVMQIDSSVPFVDVFKMSLPFDEAVRTKLTYGNILYDKDGWPINLNGGQAGTNLLHWLPAGTLPEGNYTVLYEGEGKMAYTDDARLVSSSVGKDIIHIAAGRDTYIKVTLLIKQTNPNNYLRNIRVLLPGGICRNNPFKRVNSARSCKGNYLSFAKHHEQILFNPDYLRFMRDFKTLRFMNMSGITRNDKLIAWSQMPRMDESTWAGNPGRRGAPLEVMVKLANVLNANAWFNIPERANDDLVRRYAQYVKDNLKPNLKVYLEYTNEVWNPIFTSARYARMMGLKLKLDTDFNKAQQKFYVKRAVEIFRIWKQVYGNNNKLVRVLGGWAANPKMSEFLLAYNGAYRSVDALAIAPYFHVHRKVNKNREVNSIASVFRLLEDDRNPYSLNNVKKMIEKQMVIARKYKTGLLAYEGGQHLYAPGTRSSRDYPNNFYIGANRAKAMEAIYVKSLEDWRQVTGGQLYVTFSSPRTYQAYGSWGVKEHINQAEHLAPKYRAIMRFIR